MQILRQSVRGFQGNLEPVVEDLVTRLVESKTDIIATQKNLVEAATTSTHLRRDVNNLMKSGTEIKQELDLRFIRVSQRL